MSKIRSSTGTPPVILHSPPAPAQSCSERTRNSPETENHGYFALLTITKPLSCMNMLNKKKLDPFAIFRHCVVLLRQIQYYIVILLMLLERRRP